jgi:hypothetical protein
MASVPDHKNPEVKEYEIKVFKQKYYIIDDPEDITTPLPLHEAKVEVLADDEGVFIELKEETGVTEQVSIPTPDLAVKVANYILGAYGESEKEMAVKEPEQEAFRLEQIKFLPPEVQSRIAHELWRLENHITSPHGPVEPAYAGELLKHLKAISAYLDIKPTPYKPQ